MSGANVHLPLPLVRQPHVLPGQYGVPGTDERTGLRMHPTGAVFYVDPNYPGASDNRDGTLPTDPLLTVAAALAKCLPFRGDTIMVGANDEWPEGAHDSDYQTPIQEAVVVTVPGVRIVGVNPSSPTGVTWRTPATGGPCITVHALDTLIEGFAFIGAGGTAIYGLWDGVAAHGDSLVVRHCYFDLGVDIGIQLEFVWSADIHDCVFRDCDDYGIYVDPAGFGIDHCLIHDNVFLDVDISALSLRGADDCEIFGNRIFEATAAGGGVATDRMIDCTPVAGSGNNLVHHNTLSCTKAQYPVTCKDGTVDAWVENWCVDGPTVGNP